MWKVANRVLQRFLFAKEYSKHKESKETKVERVSSFIRESTGISRGVAEAIADALVRSGRDINQLAMQKKWPIEEGQIIGPTGSVSVDEAKSKV